MIISDFKDNLSAELHGGTLNKVRNIEMLFERAANSLLSHIDPIDTMRNAGLSQLIHDDVYNYSLPSDFKDIIDLRPQDNRTNRDDSTRNLASQFDLQKALRNRTISIEGREGDKILRANWRSRQGKVLNTMDSVTANGTWSAVGTASNITRDTINHKSGNASIRFDITTTNDGIKNTSMTALDLTDEDEVADIFLWIYFPELDDPTDVIEIRWGNDVTANYWTDSTTTQADGSALRVGWNLLKFSWNGATEVGTVSPSTIDSFQIFLTGGTGGIEDAVEGIRVDNIIFSIGRAFEMDYYSKYLLKNSAGTWITRTTSDDDIIVLDNDAINLYHMETLKLAAAQLEGTDSEFDLKFSQSELNVLYKDYNSRYPSMAKKAIAQYGSRPARGRW